MKIFICLALIFLAGCPTTQINYAPYVTVSSSKYNIHLVGNNTPGVPGISVVDRALDVFVDICNKEFSSTSCSNIVSGVTIEWWGVIGVSPSTGNLMTVVVYGGNTYAGLTSLDAKGSKVAWRGTLYRSAFAHELLHYIAYAIFKDADYEHKNVKVWDVEAKINSRLKELGL